MTEGGADGERRAGGATTRGRQQGLSDPGAPTPEGPVAVAPRRRLLVDVAPLRECRQFRLLYSGQVLSYVGSQLTFVATQVQVYQLTGSSFHVGLLGLVQLVPLVLGSLVGGTLADAYDRRKVLLLAQALLAVSSAALFLNAKLDSPSLLAVYLLSGLQAGFSGLDNPTRSASVPALVPKELLASALALNQIVWHTGHIIGPALAGLVIGSSGVATAYGLDVVSFGSSIIALLLMRPIIPEGGGTKASRSSLFDGVRYLRGRQALQGTFVIDINAMVFGMPRALFPAIGLGTFGSEAVVGLLYAAPGVGSVLGAVLSGPLERVDRQGRAVLWAVVAWGASITFFGLVPWLPVALVFLAIAGASDVVSAVFRNSILQLSVPDSLRGRLSAVHISVVTGGPRLGDVEAGTVAAIAGTSASVVSGGLACIAGVAVVAKLFPALGAWRLSEVEAGDPGDPAADPSSGGSGPAEPPGS